MLKHTLSFLSLLLLFFQHVAPAQTHKPVLILSEINSSHVPDMVEWGVKADSFSNKKRVADKKKLSQFFNNLWGQGKNISNPTLTQVDNKLRYELFSVFDILKDDLKISYDNKTIKIDPWRANFNSNRGTNYMNFSEFLLTKEKKHPILLLYGEDPTQNNQTGWSRPDSLFMGYVQTPNIKKRLCFKKNAELESLRTTMAHEMGHQYLFETHPEISKKSNILEARTAHESFAVYIEYCYLRSLASKGIIPNFSIVDFINDTLLFNKSIYKVHPGYMWSFIKGLDYGGNYVTDINGNINHMSFRYPYLDEAENIIKNNEYGRYRVMPLQKSGLDIGYTAYLFDVKDAAYLLKYIHAFGATQQTRLEDARRRSIHHALQYIRGNMNPTLRATF